MNTAKAQMLYFMGRGENKIDELFIHLFNRDAVIEEYDGEYIIYSYDVALPLSTLDDSTFMLHSAYQHLTRNRDVQNNEPELYRLMRRLSQIIIPSNKMNPNTNMNINPSYSFNPGDVVYDDMGWRCEIISRYGEDRGTYTLKSDKPDINGYCYCSGIRWYELHPHVEVESGSNALDKFNKKKSYRKMIKVLTLKNMVMNTIDDFRIPDSNDAAPIIDSMIGETFTALKMSGGFIDMDWELRVVMRFLLGMTPYNNRWVWEFTQKDLMYIYDIDVSYTMEDSDE